MIKHTIKSGLKTSSLLIGERFENVMAYIPDGISVFFITDDNIWNLYDKRFSAYDVIRIGSGEGIKTLDTVRYIYEQLLNRNADRSTFIVGVGGGIVCDITGFVASTYMRGLRFGFVSSTLLSQVDASVGGKNGVNFQGYKNMVGVFNQPDFVICDMDLLNTLPKRELLCGFAEIIKTALIEDEKLLTYMEQTVDRAVALDSAVIEKLVSASVLIKSRVVNKDEKETGERRKLNFGHTFGHAIEKTTGMPHGEAVAIGMVISLALSQKLEGFSKKNAVRIIDLLEQFDLPVHWAGNWEPVFAALEKDKKRAGNDIHFVLLKDIGKAVVRKLPISELLSLARQSIPHGPDLR